MIEVETPTQPGCLSCCNKKKINPKIKLKPDRITEFYPHEFEFSRVLNDDDHTQLIE